MAITDLEWSLNKNNVLDIRYLGTFWKLGLTSDPLSNPHLKYSLLSFMLLSYKVSAQFKSTPNCTLFTLYYMHKPAIFGRSW